MKSNIKIILFLALFPFIFSACYTQLAVRENRQKYYDRENYENGANNASYSDSTTADTTLPDQSYESNGNTYNLYFDGYPDYDRYFWYYHPSFDWGIGFGYSYGPWWSDWWGPCYSCYYPYPLYWYHGHYFRPYWRGRSPIYYNHGFTSTYLRNTNGTRSTLNQRSGGNLLRSTLDRQRTGISVNNNITNRNSVTNGTITRNGLNSNAVRNNSINSTTSQRNSSSTLSSTSKVSVNNTTKVSKQNNTKSYNRTNSGKNKNNNAPKNVKRNNPQNRTKSFSPSHNSTSHSGGNRGGGNRGGSSGRGR